jgi:hypothetical protein
MHLVKRDLAHFSVAGLDVAAQQQGSLVAAFALDGLQDFGVFFVSCVYARLFGEVEAAYNADAVGRFRRRLPVRSERFGPIRLPTPLPCPGATRQMAAKSSRR